MAAVLEELSVRDLGVIASARIPLGPGVVALTGETGAGKTMIVDALHLLLGAKVDPGRVRTGSDEAVVEGLFSDGDDEWVLARTVPAEGRSRAMINGSLATAASLAEVGEQLLEVNGQHSQQTLLSVRTQRAALDRFGGIDRSAFDAARREVRQIREAIDGTGGDEQTRAREIDLCRFQVEEIDEVGPSAGESDALAAEEDLLAAAHDLQRSAQAAVALLGDDGSAVDLIAKAEGRLGDAAVFEPVAGRLRDVLAELTDCTAELRALSESIEPNEQRLAEVRARRQRLAELRRKYGPTIDDVIEFRERTAQRLVELVDHDERRAQLQADLTVASRRLAQQGELIGSQRRAAAPKLAVAVEAHLGELALPGARMSVEVVDSDEHPGAGELIEFRIAVNTGTELAPLSKVASGGELSRVMLALRLVLSEGPSTMVFDEVDAGIGGSAAVAVGQALARLGREHQVLVVTHLPQVAAYADQQIRIEKRSDADSTTTTATRLDAEERVVELARMLSGSPDSAAALDHARELLEVAAASRSAP